MIPWFQAQPLPLGPLVIQPFGLLVGLGIVLGIFVAHHRARQTGVDPEVLKDFIFLTLPLGLVCGHVLGTLFYEPEIILASPSDLLKPWLSQSSFGGFFGAVIGAFLWKSWRKKPMLPVLDACAFGMPFSWLLGRTGCFLRHDHPGRVTDIFLAVRDYQYGAPPYLPRHDLGLYEVFWSIACIALFLNLGERGKVPGVVIGTFAVFYAPVRFFLDFLRVSDGRDALGLTPGQYASGAFFGFGVAMLAYALKRADRV